MAAEYKKKKRSAFWSPYENIISKVKVCSGWNKYPSTGDTMELFDTRLNFLEVRIKPLLDSLKSYIENQQNVFFYSLRGSDILRSEQVMTLKKSIKVIWVKRDRGKPNNEEKSSEPKQPEKKEEVGPKEQKDTNQEEKKPGQVQASKKPKRSRATKASSKTKRTTAATTKKAKGNSRTTKKGGKTVSTRKKPAKPRNRTARTVTKSKDVGGLSKTKTVSEEGTVNTNSD